MIPGDETLLVAVSPGAADIGLRKIEFVPDGGATEEGPGLDLTEIALVIEPLVLFGVVLPLRFFGIQPDLAFGAVFADEDVLLRLVVVDRVDIFTKIGERSRIPAIVDIMTGYLRDAVETELRVVVAE